MCGTYVQSTVFVNLLAHIKHSDVYMRFVGMGMFGDYLFYDAFARGKIEPRHGEFYYFYLIGYNNVIKMSPQKIVSRTSINKSYKRHHTYHTSSKNPYRRHPPLLYGGFNLLMQPHFSLYTSSQHDDFIMRIQILDDGNFLCFQCFFI